VGDAAGAGVPAFSFFGSSTRIASGDGESVRRRLFDPGLGVTPENSVVNGADTSTDRSIEWTALSPKNRVAPLLVKTRIVTSKTLKFCGDLTTKMQCMRRGDMSEAEDSRQRSCSCGQVVVRVERMTPGTPSAIPVEWLCREMKDFA
jgi:hypothetical protein